MEAPWFKACKRLCAYISCSALREVDTTRILSHILGSHSEVCFYASKCLAKCFIQKILSPFAATLKFSYVKGIQQFMYNQKKVFARFTQYNFATNGIQLNLWNFYVTRTGLGLSRG